MGWIILSEIVSSVPGFNDRDEVVALIPEPIRPW